MTEKPSGIVNIRGKEYQTVAYRVQIFREKHPDWTLATEVLHRDAECVVIKASISDSEGRTISTGHSEEYRKATQINKTSALENAETSAIGRALAGLGLGGTEFASANEVIAQQNKVTPTSGAEERLSEAERRKVEGLVEEIKMILKMDGPVDAVKAYISAGIEQESDQYVYFWTFFDSKERSAMKKAKESLKEAA